MYNPNQQRAGIPWGNPCGRFPNKNGEHGSPCNDGEKTKETGEIGNEL